MSVLVDHNLEGQALLLLGTLQAQSWATLLDLRFPRLADVGLSEVSTDREVWRFARAHQMVLLTENRRMSGPDSLEQTLREENGPSSLPVLTVGAAMRLSQRIYRERCAIRLAEVLMDLDKYLGVGRLFIP